MFLILSRGSVNRPWQALSGPRAVFRKTHAVGDFHVDFLPSARNVETYCFGSEQNGEKAKKIFLNKNKKI